MVSTSRPASAQAAVGEAPLEGERAVANVDARASAYLIDSALLLAFVFVFFTIGGAILLFTSNFGEDDAPDSAYYAFIAVLAGGTLVFWSLFNVALNAWSGRSAGMYLVGLRLVDERGSSVSFGRALVRWLALHPLFFHPLLMPVWGGLAYLAVTLTLNQAILILALGFVFPCATAPIAGLIALLVDPDRRALHDRLASTLVVRVD